MTTYQLDQFGVIYLIDGTSKVLIAAAPHSREEAQRMIDLANEQLKEKAQ